MFTYAVLSRAELADRRLATQQPTPRGGQGPWWALRCKA